MRILVTGGAGFIGSHIVDLLINKNHKVAILDNLTTGHMINVNPKAKFYYGDIRNVKLVNHIFKEYRPQVVIHQAAQVSVPNSLKDPVEDARINVEGSVNLLEACRLTNVRKFIYASSAAVYGEPNYLPIDEKHPLKPQSGYGLSKLTVENYLRIYKSLYGLQYTVLRYANIYGPRQDALGEGGVVSIFINSLINNQQPTIFGDGKQTRDLVYVKDVAKANIDAINRAHQEILNVCTNKQTSINTLYQMLMNISNSNLKPQYRPSRQGDIIHSYLSDKLITSKLKWKPKWTLEQGIYEAWHYYNSENKIACLG
ncbi:MAG: NAD-dependent epimerase/dehydratase family protein [Firmicutes bacterium]|nr:NAD-dependent epimerase/dehydratase family protein [Bacillota bacterium]